MQIALWLVGAIAFDWLVSGRFAALAPSVNYHYWPLSVLRLITLLFLAGSVALAAYYGFHPEWTLLVTLVALIVYGAAIMADLERQRGRGAEDDVTRRYSEPDADY